MKLRFLLSTTLLLGATFVSFQSCQKDASLLRNSLESTSNSASASANLIATTLTDFEVGASSPKAA